MAITKNTKITAADILSAFEEKQDKLGYTPVKSVNGVSADAAGEVSDVAESEDGYIRFTNGLQICWKYITINNTDGVTVTFPKSFSANPMVSFAINGTNDTGDFTVRYSSTTKTTSMWVRASKNGTFVSGVACEYIAVGRWK